MTPTKTISAQLVRDGGASLTVNYVEYQRTDNKGLDCVLQLKILNRELSHITVHPDKSVNLHPSEHAPGALQLRSLIQLGLPGVANLPPEISQFLQKLKILCPHWFTSAS